MASRSKMKLCGGRFGRFNASLRLHSAHSSNTVYYAIKSMPFVCLRGGSIASATMSARVGRRRAEFIPIEVDPACMR